MDALLADLQEFGGPLLLLLAALIFLRFVAMRRHDALARLRQRRAPLHLAATAEEDPEGDGFERAALALRRARLRFLILVLAILAAALGFLLNS
jgi:hypothetical protein